MMMVTIIISTMTNQDDGKVDDDIYKDRPALWGFVQKGSPQGTDHSSPKIANVDILISSFKVLYCPPKTFPYRGLGGGTCIMRSVVSWPM